MSSKQATFGEFAEDSDDSDPFDFEEYGPTMDRPIPEVERAALFESGGELVDRRAIPDSGLSLSDITDWPFVGEVRENPKEIEQFQEMVAADSERLESDGSDTNHARSTTRAVADGGTVAADPGDEPGAGGYVCELCDDPTDASNRLADDTMVCDEHFVAVTVDQEAEAVGQEWVGECLYSSWGYGQTNVEFARIVEVSDSGKTVVAQMCEAEVTDRGEGSEQLAPTGETYGDEFRLHVRTSDRGVSFRGSYPYIDGDTEKGTRLDSLGWFSGASESVHQTPHGYRH